MLEKGKLFPLHKYIFLMFDRASLKKLSRKAWGFYMLFTTLFSKIPLYLMKQTSCNNSYSGFVEIALYVLLGCLLDHINFIDGAWFKFAGPAH